MAFNTKLCLQCQCQQQSYLFGVVATAVIAFIIALITTCDCVHVTVQFWLVLLPSDFIFLLVSSGLKLEIWSRGTFKLVPFLPYVSVAPIILVSTPQWGKVGDMRSEEPSFAVLTGVIFPPCQCQCYKFRAAIVFLCVISSVGQKFEMWKVEHLSPVPVPCMQRSYRISQCSKSLKCEKYCIPLQCQ